MFFATSPLLSALFFEQFLIHSLALKENLADENWKKGMASHYV
jgi:hypothetical protein